MKLGRELQSVIAQYIARKHCLAHVHKRITRRQVDANKFKFTSCGI